MYKVLIADDEEIIRCGLAQMVAQNPRLEVAALAEDGEMALEQAERIRPDIMLVDINMPFLNGLQLIGEIRKRLPNVLIIIVTGYDDFEFVHKALQLGVTDYILKPIMEEPFFALLNKAIAHLDGLQKSQKYLSWIQKQMEQNRPAMISAFFLRWLGGRLENAELAERMEYLNLHIPEPYLLTVLHLRDNNDLQHLQRGTDWDDNLLYFGCQNITQEIFSQWSETVCFRTESGALAVISRSLSPEQQQELVSKLIGPLEEYLYVKVELVQVRGQSAAGFPQVFENAMEKLRERSQYSELTLAALSYIGDHWSESGLSLQEIADSLYVTPQHLSRSFSRETGETFGTYLGRKRLNEAIRLLQDSQLKMYEIAEKTGYTSQHYFSSAFKKALGISPAEYRKTVLRQGDGE